MTARQTMIADAMTTITDRMYSVVSAPVSEDRICAIMTAIAADGRYDLDDMGLRRSRTGMVGGEMMTVQTCTYGDATLLHYYALEGFKARRVLLDGSGTVWLDIDGRAVRHNTGKYAEAAAKIMQARAN